MDQFYVQLDGFSRQLVHDYEGVMMKVARLGYSGIEIFYGLHGGYSPEGLRDFLKSIGMVVLSSHVDIQDTDQNLDYLPGTGCKYIICPGMAITSREEALQAAEQLNALGERAKAVGMKYGYHNHSNDFLEVDGKMINDILIENTDPDLVAFEIDVAWAYRAGVDSKAFRQIRTDSCQGNQGPDGETELHEAAEKGLSDGTGHFRMAQNDTGAGGRNGQIPLNQLRTRKGHCGHEGHQGRRGCAGLYAVLYRGAGLCLDWRYFHDARGGFGIFKSTVK